MGIIKADIPLKQTTEDIGVSQVFMSGSVHLDRQNIGLIIEGDWYKSINT